MGDSSWVSGSIHIAHSAACAASWAVTPCLSAWGGPSRREMSQGGPDGLGPAHLVLDSGSVQSRQFLAVKRTATTCIGSAPRPGRPRPRRFNSPTSQPASASSTHVPICSSLTMDNRITKIEVGATSA